MKKMILLLTITKETNLTYGWFYISDKQTIQENG